MTSYKPGDKIEAHGTTFTVVATPESHPDEPPREGDSVMHTCEDNDIVVQDYGWGDWGGGPDGPVIVHRAKQPNLTPEEVRVLREAERIIGLLDYDLWDGNSQKAYSALRAILKAEGVN